MRKAFSISSRFSICFLAALKNRIRVLVPLWLNLICAPLVLSLCAGLIDCRLSNLKFGALNP